MKNLPAMPETPVRFLGWGRSAGEGIGYPLQCSGPENPMPWVCKELDVTDWIGLTFTFTLSFSRVSIYTHTHMYKHMYVS